MCSLASRDPGRHLIVWDSEPKAKTLEPLPGKPTRLKLVSTEHSRRKIVLAGCR